MAPKFFCFQHCHFLASSVQLKKQWNKIHKFTFTIGSNDRKKVKKRRRNGTKEPINGDQKGKQIAN